jgi:hypothetical protein
MMVSGEMFIELGDSWFIAKTILVVVSLLIFIQYSTRFVCSHKGIIRLMICQMIDEKVYYQERNNSIHRLKFLNYSLVN